MDGNSKANLAELGLYGGDLVSQDTVWRMVRKLNKQMGMRYFVYALKD